MIKRILSLIMALLLMSSFTVVHGATDTTKTVQAAYGTPQIDGAVDSIWDSTNYTVIDTITTGEVSYTGWMKFLWDESNIYVLSKVYSTDFSDANINPAWHDCITYYFDENFNRSSAYKEDDYSICVNFKGETYIENYSGEVSSKASLNDNYYMVELAIPFKSITPKDGVKIGLDSRVRRTDVFGYNANVFAWNSRTGSPGSNTSTHGTLELKKNVAVVDFVEPQFVLPDYSTTQVIGIDRSDVVELINDVSVMFDGAEYTKSVLHVEDYPCMEINDLAQVIGASVENGNTIVKDGQRITFTVGERLAQDNQGNIMLQCEPVIYQNAMYVPVGILEITYIYNIEYNRFKKMLDIIPVHAPKTAEVVFNVRDFGAVGDGKTDDKQAVLNAIYAAKNCGKPSKVEFEAGKTYFISEVPDSRSVIDFTGMKDFVLEGNGCKILFQQPIEEMIEIQRCSRLTIRNITFDATERFLSQGTVVNKSEDDGTLTIKWEDWSPRPAPKEWMESYGQEYNEFGMIMHPTENHPILLSNDHIRFDDWEELEDGTYKMFVASSYKSLIPFIKEGYRLSLIMNAKNYDVLPAASSWRSYKTAMNIYTSEDILLENVNMYGSSALGTSIGYNIGNITLRNYNFLTHEGEISSSCRDLIHCKNNRGGLVIENGTYIGGLDDQININGSVAKLSKKVAERTYSISSSLNMRQGDELLFMETNTGKPLGIAFVESIERSGAAGTSLTITLDRDVEGILATSELQSGQVATDVYNQTTSTCGTVIRNNTFKNGRRHVLLSRAANLLFENNYAENMHGGIVNLENGAVSFTESTCPSTSTVRNNRSYNAERTNVSHPPMGTDNYVDNNYATVDGALFEGNVIETQNSQAVFLMFDATDLYLINNTIKINDPISTEVFPVAIANCEIKLIDGLTIESTADLPVAIGIAKSVYNPENIRNIRITGAGQMDLCKDFGEN